MEASHLGLVLDSSILIAAERRNLTADQAIETVQKTVGEIPIINLEPRDLIGMARKSGGLPSCGGYSGLFALSICHKHRTAKSPPIWLS